MNRIFAVSIGGLVLAFSGCGGPAAVSTIGFSPDRMAADALAAFDANKDGKLDSGELKKCPSLFEGMASADTNSDKGIDSAELVAKFAAYRTGGVSLRDLTPRVVRGGRPVAGVTVTLQPESFMGGAIQPATGVSGPTGDVPLQVPGQPYPGAQVGCYQVIVSQKDAAGKEQLAAKYNSATTLGIEVGPSNRINLVIDLEK